MWLRRLIDLIRPREPEAIEVSTRRDLVNTKAATAAALAADASKLAADQATVAADQVKIAADQAADRKADADIAASIAPPAGNGYAVDPKPNDDGTFNVLITDLTPVGYHTIKAPSLDSDLAPPAPTPASP